MLTLVNVVTGWGTSATRRASWPRYDVVNQGVPLRSLAVVVQRPLSDNTRTAPVVVPTGPDKHDERAPMEAAIVITAYRVDHKCVPRFIGVFTS